MTRRSPKAGSSGGTVLDSVPTRKDKSAAVKSAPASRTSLVTDVLEPLAPGAYLGVPQVARMALFAKDPGPAILITTPERAALFANLDVFGSKVAINPGIGDWQDLPSHVVLDTATALLPFPEDPKKYRLELKVGTSITRDDFLDRLELYGFDREENLTPEELEKAEGYFKVQGDTLFIHVGEKNNDAMQKIRVEFDADEIETIKVNDEKRKNIALEPTSGFIPEVAWTSTRLAALKGNVYLDGMDFYESALYGHTEQFYELLKNKNVIAFGNNDHLKLREQPSPIEPLPFYRARLRQFGFDARNWLEAKYKIVILLKHERSGKYLQEKILEGIKTNWAWHANAATNEITFVKAQCEGGFIDRDKRIAVLSEDLLYGFQGGSVLRSRKLRGPPVHDALALAPGDYLIHPEHGIGQFLGLEARRVVGKTRDYLILRYASKDSNEAKLYLPVEQLPLIRRHPGTTDDPPRLSILGTNEWSRTREKARVNAEELAAKLLVQYAARQATLGMSFPETKNDWDKDFYKNFPYELTLDQDQAVKAVLRDLKKSQPMDRLVSGDVGFGKTEVAVRAAHRVVSNGYQVAVLVPTTLLSEQHLETFKQRFENTPVIVAGLSRFTSAKEATEIIKGLKRGTIDIVVGTHRLLAQEVEFKQLGLLVIDEEHRFGVVQKEKLKALKTSGNMSLSSASNRSEKRAGRKNASSLEDKTASIADSLESILGNVIGDKKPKEISAAPEHAIDVLSLSATPIPRTLYMSMVGLRDISHIATPPMGRKPIQTVLTPFEQVVVRDAILNEIERGGKTFYIHDRVASIERRAHYLRLLVPEARIAVAHGQMPDHEIEEIMLGFEEGAFDVLIATTIVESGLDIPEANTILIERADRLGLAQLYQLRGRVGRRSTEAYAYLFYPPRLTETAERRLWAIADLADLGSGHLLAEKDMEIRGIGNILGAEQHGHIQLVSLEVYTELLAEAIAKLKGEAKTEPPRLAIDLAVDARLTPEYLAAEVERIEYYGRLSESTSLGEIAKVERELKALHGKPPRDEQNFMDLARLRVVGSSKNAIGITENMTDLIVVFAKNAGKDFDARGLKKLDNKVEVTQYPPGFKISKKNLKPDEYARAILETLYLFA